MADQTQNADESLTTDNVSTGAKIVIGNDAPENLYAMSPSGHSRMTIITEISGGD